ncbi:bifunctional diguanylate cyclase/phosphodiesterase [Jannaschia sp. M317]|uniref:bifunctional diguanylate cyclase/phosphodiesterase n=1 Tax=Jannaschia sp. M317 TaxID=2867011 RepID=UPI0021A83749|nr:EAL domain-containing protein [Jannaschia sp. M317]UWQ19172.1 EAL domain-containing protein [Jannaschia sp. M317]
MITATTLAALMIGSAAGGALFCSWWHHRRRDDAPSANVAPTRLALTETGNGALALLDVDDLAGLNRVNGYDTGDRLLNQIEDVLRRILTDGLGLERLDSGRFLVWLPDQDIASARAVVERMRDTASRSYVHGAQGQVARTLSAGLVATTREEGRGRAMVHAGAAVARAKSLGGNRLELAHSRPAPPAGPTRDEVIKGIASGALCYYLQPIMDLRRNRVAGLEALLRWTREDGAVIGPGAFVDQLDRIPDHTEDLFPALTEDAARPFVHGPDPLFLAVNINATVLDGAGSTGCLWLQEVLRRLPPDRLVVEIVETAVIAQPERAAMLVDKLRAQGVRVALDDFGTGLSNLDRLQKTPVDFLKIDRAFTCELGGDGRAEAILRNLVRMARDLNIEIIAEGIETEAQACAVSDLGIRYGQGYHFGRPAPASDWARCLEREPALSDG